MEVAFAQFYAVVHIFGQFIHFLPFIFIHSKYNIRRNFMTPQEKTLYHQIHPFKLFTDISAEFVSLYLFWRHKLIAGLVAMFVPPIIASLLIIKLVNLETYKQSAFGRYIRVYMTPSVVTVRVLGTVVTHIGAWHRIPALIPL